MKKLVLASAAMGGAALIAFGASGTFAAFNDAAAVSGSAGAGTLVLDGSSNGGSVAVYAPALQPGKSTTQAYFFQNAGSMDGSLVLTMTGLIDKENGCSGAEGDAGIDPNGCGEGATGEFSSTASIAAGLATVAKAADCTASTATTTYVTAGTNIATVANKPVTPYLVPKGSGACLVVTLALPDTANDNAVQGDSATFSVDAVLTQV